MSFSTISRAGADIWKMLGQIDTLAVDPLADLQGPCKENEVAMTVQVNGKLRGTVVVDKDLDDDAVIAKVLADERIARFLEKQPGKVQKTTVIRNELVNLIVK